MNRELVKALARGVVHRLAPGESEVFDTLADASLDHPERVLGGDRSRDDPLGSGLTIAVPYVTPAVVYVSMRVLELVTDRTLEHLGERARTAVFRRLRPKHQPAAASTTVTLDEACELLDGRDSEVRETAVEAGLAGGLSQNDAERVADFFVARIRQVREGQNLSAAPTGPSRALPQPDVEPEANS